MLFKKQNILIYIFLSLQFKENIQVFINCDRFLSIKDTITTLYFCNCMNSMNIMNVATTKYKIQQQFKNYIGCYLHTSVGFCCKFSF